MTDAATLPFARSPARGQHPSGCSTACRGSHLTAVALDRIIKSGVEIDEIRAVLDDEEYAHHPTRNRAGLTPIGKKNLVRWGATPAEVEEIEREPEPEELSFAERERRRVRAYVNALDPDVRRARARDASKRYRERQRGRTANLVSGRTGLE